MAYKDELARAERLIDKMNQLRQDDGEAMRQIKDLQQIIALVGCFSLLQALCLVVFIASQVVH